MIAKTGRPVLAPTKRWRPSSATSCGSFTTPSNISFYYDYYQPEAYVPVSDTYTKTASINEEIDMPSHWRRIV